MDVNEIKVFLSCSSREEDRPINELIKAICRGLGINCVNVAKGYTELPPEKAKEYIDGASALLAVISRLEKLSEAEYAMPAAVREEIAMAYYGNKPLRLITEEGVRVGRILSELWHCSSIYEGAYSEYRFYLQVNSFIVWVKNGTGPNA